MSDHTVTLSSYATALRISYNATRSQIVEMMIKRSYEYLDIAYKWDWAGLPGTGVDCAGLVMRPLHAVGMNPSPMNPYDHIYTSGYDQ